MESSEARLATLLAEQIRELALAGKDEEAILSRAGQAGRLLPDLYRISYNANFYDAFVGLGTRIAHVENAIRQPTKVQHFVTDPVSKVAPFSLFLQFHAGTRPKDSFWLAVVAQRQGQTLIVHCAWRIYPSNVDLQDAQEPIDVLEAFVKIFGLAIVVGKTRGKFIINEEFPRIAGESLRTYSIRGTGGVAYFGMLSMIDLPDRHRVVMAFAIDTTCYLDCLISHGVRASLKSTPETREEIQIPLKTIDLGEGIATTSISQNKR
jgi:hypothetical protein